MPQNIGIMPRRNSRAGVSQIHILPKKITPGISLSLIQTKPAADRPPLRSRVINQRKSSTKPIAPQATFTPGTSRSLAQSEPIADRPPLRFASSREPDSLYPPPSNNGAGALAPALNRVRGRSLIRARSRNPRAPAVSRAQTLPNGAAKAARQSPCAAARAAPREPFISRGAATYRLESPKRIARSAATSAPRIARRAAPFIPARRCAAALNWGD